MDFSKIIFSLLKDLEISIDEEKPNEENDEKNDEENEDDSDEEENQEEEEETDSEDGQSDEQDTSVEDEEMDIEEGEVDADEDSWIENRSKLEELLKKVGEQEYKVYTKDFDQEVKAEELCDSDELSRLRGRLDQLMESSKNAIAKLANRLQRLLLAQQNRFDEGDLRVKSGLISDIAPGGGLDPLQNDTVIDATGLHLLPGAIDPHVHFREPGDLNKEDLETGSRAAAAGGVTSFLDMPNNNPNTINRSTLENKINLASQKSVTHHGFFIGATKDHLRDLQSVEGMDGVCGIKIFMGSSTGDLLVHEQEKLESCLLYTSDAADE